MGVLKADNHSSGLRSIGIQPSDFTSLSQWGSGGCVLTVYDSSSADGWISANYHHSCLIALRKQGYGGPIASRLSVHFEALTVFGNMSPLLLDLANDLAELSGFPVIVRPPHDDPLPHLKCR